MWPSLDSEHNAPCVLFVSSAIEVTKCSVTYWDHQHRMRKIISSSDKSPFLHRCLFHEYFLFFFFRSTLPLSQEDYEVMEILFVETGSPLISKICSVEQPLVYMPEVKNVRWSVMICLWLKVSRFCQWQFSGKGEDTWVYKENGGLTILFSSTEKRDVLRESSNAGVS